MQDPNCQADDRSHRASVGAALHALRAYTKARTLASTSREQFRYELSADSNFGVIYNGKGEVVDSGPVEQWAQLGKPIRFALIGLKYMRERCEQARVSRSAPPVRYHLDALSAQASLTFQGMDISAQDLLKNADKLWLSPAAISVLQSLEKDELSTVDGWSKFGQQLEKDYFKALHAAQKYDLVDAVFAEKERGYRLGIFRRKLGECE